MNTTVLKGNIIDILNKKIYKGIVYIQDGKIQNIESNDHILENEYILPGFIDSHIHIESSLLIPSEFARLAVLHGTVATVSDPHEIANVCGLEGIKFMIENGKKVPFHFFWGAPSCVPATNFETAGATINSVDIEKLLANPDIFYLAEMMNFPGVLNNDAEVFKKIQAAKKNNKPVDGHAPGLRGKQAEQYINAGIYTDHECFTLEEAKDKLLFGMHILIREGSAAKNFDALFSLIDEFPNKIMFCSDDKHPDSLLLGHINELCARAVLKKMNIFNILQAACVNPVLYYKLPVGLLKIGDNADCIVVEDLIHFKVKQTFIKGELVHNNEKSCIKKCNQPPINFFNCTPINHTEIIIDILNYPIKNNLIPVIGALENQLITETLWVTPTIKNNQFVTNVENDILKIIVVNRYSKQPIAKGFIKNIGLKKGAFASSVAHDSHNIIAVGVDDESIVQTVNEIIKYTGGICCCENNSITCLPLPVAGLMSNQDGFDIAQQYMDIDKKVKNLGSPLKAPFMTLSFMALLVIPHIKISDKGLFNGDSFDFF